MSNEPSWEDIFKPQPSAEKPAQQPAATDAQAPFQPPALVEPTAQSAVAPEQVAPVQSPQVQPARSADDDSFARLFSPESSAAPVASTQPVTAALPGSRRELREAEARRVAAGVTASGGGNGTGGPGDGGKGRGRDREPRDPRPKKKRSLLWLKITLPIAILLGAVGGVGAFAWLNYEEQVREVLGWQLPTDYEGTGNGEEVIVTVNSGDIGSDIAQTLHDSGVTMTFDAFYDLLLGLDTDPGFMPGNYSLQKEMSAQSALDALLNPENKVTDRLLITEGTVLPDALEIIAETTGIPLEEVQAASLDLASFGIPAEAPSLEGYLFPATYTLDGGQSAHDILQLLVNTMFERLDAAGVPVEDRHRILTMAALIQREAGAYDPNDFYKVSRVFYNRIDQGINLESDATVAYGAGTLHTVWTSDEDRANAANPYNTYANPGLPIGPIGAPGELAIDAALHPADGPWLFFVPINLATGETYFSETVDEHEAAAERLREWCRESDENASYCE